MSAYLPERIDGRGINLSNRYAHSAAVVASPAAGAETIIATITLPSQVQTFSAVRLTGYAAFTVGTSGVSAELQIRQTDTSGTALVTSGALTVTAADLVGLAVLGFDIVPSAGQVYVLTLTVGSGAAESTVSAVALDALIV